MSLSHLRKWINNSKGVRVLPGAPLDWVVGGRHSLIMKTGRSFHTNIYPVRVFAFVSLVSLLMLKGSMPAQDAGVWTAVLPALIVFPHIVYLLSIVRPKEPLSIGGAFAIARPFGPLSMVR